MTKSTKNKPTPEELQAAIYKTLPDLLDYDLKAVFCGINPGLYTAAIGYAYGHPGNRFWPTLFAAGFTPRLFDPSEQAQLLPLGYGLTNVVARTTKSEAELTRAELLKGGEILMEKLAKYRPEWVSFVGIGAYRKAFNRPQAAVGPQTETFGSTKIWLLPSTSGLNASFAGAKLIDAFKEFKKNL